MKSMPNNTRSLKDVKTSMNKTNIKPNLIMHVVESLLLFIVMHPSMLQVFVDALPPPLWRLTATSKALQFEKLLMYFIHK